jgi:hypothetical protein
MENNTTLFSDIRVIVIPAQAGIQVLCTLRATWILAFAIMTGIVGSFHSRSG